MSRFTRETLDAPSSGIRIGLEPESFAAGQTRQTAGVCDEGELKLNGFAVASVAVGQNLIPTPTACPEANANRKKGKSQVRLI